MNTVPVPIVGLDSDLEEVGLLRFMGPLLSQEWRWERQRERDECLTFIGAWGDGLAVSDWVVPQPGLKVM